MNESKSPPNNSNQGSNRNKDGQKSRNYKRRYADDFKFAPVGYFTFDPAGVILNVNPDGAMLLGSDRNGLLHQSFTDYIAP